MRDEWTVVLLSPGRRLSGRVLVLSSADYLSNDVPFNIFEVGDWIRVILDCVISQIAV